MAPHALINVRKAAIDDARAIADIHIRGWQIAYSGLVPEKHLRSLCVDSREELWRGRIAKDATQLWVAELAGRVSGWMTLDKCRDTDALGDGPPTIGELWAIYVDPEHWRSGVGQALWQRGVEHARTVGFHEITVWVLEQNRSALAFYASLGFTVDAGIAQTLSVGGAELSEVRLRNKLS